MNSSAVNYKTNWILAGIALTDDRIKTGENSTVFVIGSVCLEDLQVKLDELKGKIKGELDLLPTSFTFLSKEGWPILTKQEPYLKAFHVINENNIIQIKKQFEKQRIGVVTPEGEPIGFVFIDINSDLKQLREAFEQQLKINSHLKTEYRFREKNGWPIMQSQEAMLTLMDIMTGHVVCIQYCGKTEEATFKPTRPTSVAFANTTSTTDNPCLPPSVDAADGEIHLHSKKSFKFLRADPQLSLKSKKGSHTKAKAIKNAAVCSQPILISYVRAEGSKYALDLKHKLVQRGFSVYLDVHEIKTGTDWQDSLNFAVTHCFLFIPLITTMYGKTQWTNREIKLADVLGKLIIPVNFTDHWPPACLAIQFSSTQYIPWKVQDTGKNEIEKATDCRNWPECQVNRVAVQIAECYKENSEKVPRLFASDVRDGGPRLRSVYTSKEDSVAACAFYYDEPFEEKKRIVISAHPKQQSLAQEVMALFKKDGHEIWCSIDLHEKLESIEIDDMSSSLPNTPKKLLPTIDEGEVFFSQTNCDVVDYKGPSFKESHGRRPLSRLMSQFSDISQPFSLSEENLVRLRTFQQQVDQAGVVVVLVSEEYTKSTFSHQQVFYCEHRKRVVLMKCDNSVIPKWFKLLMGNDMIMHNNPQFECVLKARVSRALNPSSSETPKDAAHEAKINYLVSFVKCNIPLRDIRLYITGSSKLQARRTEDICRVLGRELAKDPTVSLVTGGFFGAPDITAKAFYDYCENSGHYYPDDSAIQHILPIHEAEDLSSKARQNPDGSFEVMPYGKTIFIGDSLKERETVVARLLDICIVIEGGPGVLHEVEEFIWNDRFVIPIRSTGGAASGKYGIPMKIFELPNGVDMADWAVLSDESVAPEDVSKAVINIILSLRNAVSSPVNLLKKPGFTNHKNRKRSKKVVHTSEDKGTGVSSDMLPYNEIYRNISDDCEDHSMFQKATCFQRLLEALRLSHRN